MHDIVAPRYQLAANRPTGDLLPKTFMTKTSGSLLKRNSAAMMKTEGATKIFP
jgi:hypothetical protein